MVTGNAYFDTCPLCKQRNNNFRAAATYSYNVKGTNTGGRLLRAEVREVHQFTPFNEIDGAVVVEARQRLVLATVQEQIHSTPENNDYITKESLRYHFERKLIQTPIQLLRTKNAENQITTLLQHLVEHNMGPLSKVSPIKFLQLVQHLRKASMEEIEGLWESFSGRLHYRRWILDAIPAIGNHFSLRFLKLKLKELSEFEAAQAVPLALHLIKADGEAIAEAKALLEAVNAHCGSLVRKVGYLAYGSLVHKFCSQTQYCTEEALQPLHNLLAEANEAVDMMDIILALKGLGNSAQAASIKKILKFLPRIISTASNLPLPVQVAASLALRNIAKKHPIKILDICQELYMDIQQHPIIRSIAASIILDNKPSPAIVMMIAKSLMKEADMEVGSYVYSLMKKFSRSAHPALHEVAAICNMAVEVLKSRFEATQSHYSSGLFYDIYSDSLKSGLQGIFNILPKAADVFPAAAIGRLKMHFMGVFTELLEIGYHAEGLQELLMNRHLFSSGSGLNNIKKIMDMLKKLHDWKALPWDEPLVFAHFKMFGQELFYQEFNKHSIENILKFFSSGKCALLQAAVKALQTGLEIRWSKPLLSSENRRIVPTCVGLPLETNLYYSSVTRVQLQAQSHITPEPKDDVRILQLLESNINLKAKLSLSMTKDIVFMIGVNTNLIQAGLEQRTQVSLVLPANVDVNLNIGQKHFKMDFIPELPDNELFAIRSKAFVVTRNSEDLAAAKMTPIVAAGTEPNVLKKTFSPKGLSAGDASRAKGKFSDEVLSTENAYWSEPLRRRPRLSDVSACAKAGDLGFQVCFIENSLTAAFVCNCPLYHIIGDHSVKVLVKPVHTGASVEKIQIEFQAGPGATMKMVRSVNVRRADGGIQELENPIDRVALSKLQKILGTSEITQKVGSRNSSLSNESSLNSGNTSQFSPGSESSKRANASTASQEKQRLQNGTKGGGHQHKSHRHSAQETQHEIYPHHPGKHKRRDKKKEMEIHCKCWPENIDHHNPSRERWEEEHHPKVQHTTKGRYSKEQHQTPHKGQYESREKGHQNKHHEGERDRQHKGEHERGNQGEHQIHKHEQGEAKQQHSGHHEAVQQHQDKYQHTKGGPDSKQKGHQSKGQHGTHHKGEYKRRENGSQQKHHESERDRQHKREHQGVNQGEHQKHKQGEGKEHQTGHHEGTQEHQNKDQHTKGGPDSQKKGQHSKHETHHKDQHESRENGHHHQDQHTNKEADSQDKGPHETHHKGEHERRENGNQQKHHEGEENRRYKGEHEKENQQHKQGEATEHHKVHDKGVQEHQDKDQHKGHQKETQIPNSKEPKRNCTCWQKPKDSGPHHKEEQKDRHHRTKCHPSQGKASNKKKCKFLSSESSSSSADSSQSEGKHEPKSKKWHRIQQQNSDSNSLSGKSAKGHRRHRKGTKKRPNLGHQKQHKESKKHRKELRRHHKDGSSTFPNTGLNDTRTSISQHEIYSIPEISSNLLEFFEVGNINSKFESTSTLTHGRATKSSSSSSYYNPSSYKYSSGRRSSDFVLLVKAFMSGSQHKGYQTTAHLERSHAQAEIVSLDQKSSWKTCFDASVSGFHKASATIKWGTNCQDYIIAAKVSTGQMSGDPAIQLSWQWKRLPSWINGLTESVMPFVPGVAYTLGFSELHRQNTPHQVTVRVASTSTDTIDTILRTPEMTIYKQGIPFPLDLPFATHWIQKIHLMDVTALPDVTSLVKRTSEAVCKVDTEKIVTFDGMNLGCSLSPAPCYTVIAQDCSNQLRFLVAMKKTGQGFSTFEINVKLRSSDIKIHCDTSEEFHVQLNGMWLLLTNDTYINEKECIRIHKNATSVTVKAPKNGVEEIAINGQSVQIQISPLMHGQTCGLCGDADHNQHNDWKKPNREQAKSCNGLVHSWTVPGGTCQSGCALTRQYMMLEDQLIDERQSTCYSAEPVLTCVKGCHPTARTPFPVAFHCLPKDAAIGLADWQANPRESSEDLIKDVDAHTGCACTEECSATQQ
ncbi:vitellogenin-1-like [Rana temporaria]|uniref:vitellogenin-1-like n=1 Tax=Rana temporaria TaxID=8407 RepID=UPI001AADA451|nr:vitellogenin-1-like [Rana temporaria]